MIIKQTLKELDIISYNHGLSPLAHQDLVDLINRSGRRSRRDKVINLSANEMIINLQNHTGRSKSVNNTYWEHMKLTDLQYWSRRYGLQY